jgi:hypothetical protein
MLCINALVYGPEVDEETHRQDLSAAGRRALLR